VASEQGAKGCDHVAEAEETHDDENWRRDVPHKARPRLPGGDVVQPLGQLTVSLGQDAVPYEDTREKPADNE